MKTMSDKCIVGLCGPIGAGKDYTARLIFDLSCKPAAVLRFADPMKRSIESMYGLPAGALEDRNLKESEAPCTGGKTYRKITQLLGTEWGREMISRGFWIDLLFWRAEQCPDLELIIIPDVRFMNEYEAIHRRGGYLLEIVPDVQLDTKADTSHASERELSKLSRVAVAQIHNDFNGTEGLERQLKPILRALKYSE